MKMKLMILAVMAFALAPLTTTAELKSPADATETRTANTAKLVRALGPDRMISYEPKSEKYRIIVFTDIHCGYCRKLHGELPALLDGGVRVDYIPIALFKGERGYKRTVSMWCAPDRNKALHMAKLGGKIWEAKCDNPIDENIKLSKKVGVTGTPYIIMPDDSVIRGAVSAEELIARLEKTAKGA